MQTIRTLIFILIATVGYAANLVPNSSFELGYNRGWLEYSTGPNDSWGNLEFGTTLITNRPYHGRNALLIPHGARAQGRAIWLTAGTYTISFYGEGSGSFPFGMMREVELGGNPVNVVTLTGTMTRYSANFTATSNAFYYPKFGWASQEAVIDAVQLETGSTATTYAPEATVECGLSIPNTNNMWFSGDSPTFKLNFWNSGSTTNIRVNYEVFDAWNAIMQTESILTTVEGGTNSSRSVSLSSIGSGWHRIVSRLPTVSDSYDEITTVIYPYTSNSTYTTTSWLGGHPHISEFHSHRERLARRMTARNLSPNTIASRWQLVQPNAMSDFNFYDVCFTNWSTEGLDQICILSPAPDHTYNHWATNADGTASMPAWSNYCFRVVDRVANTLHLTNVYFEIFNEPMQSELVTPIAPRYETNYAKLLTYGVWAVTNAYPNAKIVGMGGAYGDGTWARNVWDSLDAGTKAAITVVSCHNYPTDNAIIDSNIGEYFETHANNAASWVRKFSGIREVWNTECGIWDTGPILGLNGVWPVSYEVHWTPEFESNRQEWMNRALNSTMKILTMALRNIGAGVGRFIYLDARFFNDSSFGLAQPYAADYLQVDRPAVVSLSVASSILAKGLGPVTNAALGAYVELYSGTNFSGQAVVAGWSADRANRVLTLTNSNFKLLDCMGRQTQTNSLTAKLTRLPQYFVSGTLTVAQLSNTLANATSVTVPDVLAPNISIDIIPSGLWNGDTNYQFVKWTAMDDTYSQFPSLTSNTNIAYRWRLDNGSWSAYSASNHVWLGGLTAGNHTFYVNAIDAEGNVGEKSYGFVPSSSTLTVRNDLTVQTLTVGP